MCPPVPVLPPPEQPGRLRTRISDARSRIENLRRGRRISVSMESTTSPIEPGPPNDAAAGTDAGVVEIVKVTFCVLLPPATLEGEKLQLLAEGRPLQAKDTLLASGAPFAAFNVSW